MLVSKRLFKAVSGPSHSFSFKTDTQPYFYDKYHHHPEYEFSFIEKGAGIRFVGDSIEPFQPGDMVLLGPNLSHMWKCDSRFYGKNDKLLCRSFVIHFPETLFSDMLASLPEMNHVKRLLEECKQGLKVEGGLKKRLISMFRQLPGQHPSERLITLLQMLHLTASVDHLKPLSQSFVADRDENGQSERLNVIYNYLLAHLQEKITLDRIASIAHMSPPAFCRFFKKKTGKNFTHILNEMRINYACRLLTEEKEKIAQVALASGFANLSHFNKQFKNITGLTPREFLQRK